MALDFYILDELGEPVALQGDVGEVALAWGRWCQEHQDQRIVQQTEVAGVMVSTVFLFIDHAFFGGPPVLWETMIFGGPHDMFQERYMSRAAAIAGHWDAVEKVRSALGLPPEPLPIATARSTT